MRDSRNGRKKLATYLWVTLYTALIFMPIGRAEDQWRIRINIPEFKLYLYQGLELY